PCWRPTGSWRSSGAPMPPESFVRCSRRTCSSRRPTPGRPRRSSTAPTETTSIPAPTERAVFPRPHRSHAQHPEPPMSPAIASTLILRELRAMRREVDAYPNDGAPWRLLQGLPNSGGTLVLHCAGNLQHYVGAVLGVTRYVPDRPAEVS